MSTPTSIAGSRLLKRLGEDEYGISWLARRHGQWVVIKTLHPYLIDHAVRFERSLATLLRLRHPHVAAPIACGQDDQTAYAVAPWFQGEPLDELLHRLDREGRAPMDPRQVAAIGAQIADALDHLGAHGLVHGEIAPARVLITVQGEAVLTGLDVPREITRPTTQGMGVVRGGIEFMSPEQIRGLTATSQSDIFALGLVLHTALTGVNPFRAETSIGTLVAILNPQERPAPPSSLNPAVDEALDAVIQKATALDPGARWASGGAMAEALKACIGPRGRSAGAGRVDLVEALGRVRGWMHEGRPGMIRGLLERHPELSQEPALTQYIWDHLSGRVLGSLRAGEMPDWFDVALMDLLPEAIAGLSGVLVDEALSEESRATAAWLLGELEAGEAGFDLARVLDKPLPLLVNQALDALGRLPSPPPLGVRLGPFSIKPCEVPWETLEQEPGQDFARVRHCGQCERRVVRADDLDALRALVGVECVSFNDARSAEARRVEVRCEEARVVLEVGESVSPDALMPAALISADLAQLRLHNSDGLLTVEGLRSWGSGMPLRVGTADQVDLIGGWIARTTPGTRSVRIERAWTEQRAAEDPLRALEENLAAPDAPEGRPMDPEGPWGGVGADRRPSATAPGEGAAAASVDDAGAGVGGVDRDPGSGSEASGLWGRIKAWWRRG